MKNNENDLKDYMLILKDEYSKLLEQKAIAETKALQYKNLILANTSNNLLLKSMCAIENKSLYDLMQEKSDKDE